MNKIIEQLRDVNNKIKDIEQRKAELKKKLEQKRSSITPAELEAIKTQKAELDAELRSQQAVKSTLSELAQDKEKEQNGGRDFFPGNRELRVTDLINANLNDSERRSAEAALKDTAAEFKRSNHLVIKGKEITDLINSEKRAITTASSGVVTPTRVGGIGNPFNEAITIFDQVDVQDMTGIGQYEKSFLKKGPTASTKQEGQTATESDPTFGAVVMTPESVGTLSYMSREMEKLTPLNYLQKIVESSAIALKVKLSEKIATKIKTGTDKDGNAMYQTLTASTANGMLNGTKGQINERTLRQIALNYGGDNNVYGNAVLYLSKQDLIAFGDVRGTNEKKYVYEITPNQLNPNIGTISDGGLTVLYCIIPALTPLSGTAQGSSAVQTMLYGSPFNFEMDIFGDFGVTVSSEYKFAENQLTIRGEVMAGGSVTVQNGFTVITIPATTT